MSKKYFNSRITNPKVVDAIDNDLINSVSSLKSIFEEKMDQLKVNEALDEIMNVLSKCNKYIDETAPWILAKEESKKDRLETVLYNLLESIRICAILLTPFIPSTSEEILNILNTSVRGYETIDSFGALEENHKLNEPKILFTRIDMPKEK